MNTKNALLVLADFLKNNGIDDESKVALFYGALCWAISYLENNGHDVPQIVRESEIPLNRQDEYIEAVFETIKKAEKLSKQHVSVTKIIPQPYAAL